MKGVFYFFTTGLLMSFNIFSNGTFDEMAKDMAEKFKAPTISVKGLEKLMSLENTVLMDARELNEFQVSHIKGAIHVGYKKFDMNKVLSLVKSNSKIIVYCSVGYRSGDITSKLKNLGIQSFNLYGGIFNWSNSGKELFNSKGELTNKIHGFDKSWSKWITRGNIVFK